MTTVRISRGAFANRRIDRDLCEATEGESRYQSDERRSEVRPVRCDDQRRGEHRGEASDISLSEVDDPVRAIHEHQTHRDQRRQGAEDEPEREDWYRRGVDDEHEDEDDERDERDVQREALLRVFAETLDEVDRCRGSARA